jgi:hypothetical protein
MFAISWRGRHLFGMLTIDDVARALERARDYALPGREAATRNALLCELHRRLLDREPRQIKSHQAERFELRLMRD